MHKAEVADFHEAIGQDMLEEPVDKLHGVEARGVWAGTAGFAIGEGNGTLLEGDDTAVGDGDSEDREGEVLAGCGPVWVGLAMNVPVGLPNLWIDPFKQSRLAHVVFEESAVDGGEGFNGDKEVDSGRQPLGAVLGEATPWNDVMDVRVLLELSSPGVQDTSKTREVGADEARIFGELFKGRRRRLEQGLIGETLMGAAEGTQGFRDGEGEEKMRSWELFIQGVLEPLLGLIVLTLRAVAIAAGVVDAVLSAAALALIEAVAVISTLAILDGAYGLSV
jgi:hypothetical protein